MYVLACPCIHDPGLRARGITRESDIRAFQKALARCREFGIDVVLLPCPETLFLGKDREPGTFLERLNTETFFHLLDRLERDVEEIIRTRGPPLCIVGVNSSPTCGVDATYYGDDGKGPARREGRGVFLARFPGIPAIDVIDFSRYRIYLAAPLFSAAERRYNVHLRDILTAHFFSVFLPQEAGDDSSHRDEESQRRIFSRCCEEITRSDIMVAVIDGADADSGTSWEMGYAYARGIPVVALRTDFRRAGMHEHVNLMLERSSTVVREENHLLKVLRAPFHLDCYNNSSK
ncbi:MAG: nucleoside 2-deoxyribosyltransferase [Methanolinea sp.]|nr:nucleoside 2-deoxyribosyltransferase [Methanolinea sp.]